uniref:Cystatin domain-containing protein n=1 Tax=Cyprinus carpio TaxID=7962 RepID=A0A8C1QDW4_CYPCA
MCLKFQHKIPHRSFIIACQNLPLLVYVPLNANELLLPPLYQKRAGRSFFIIILGEGLCLQSKPITAVVICVDQAKHQANSTALQLLVKMRGLLFLLNALLLLESTKGLMKYDELNDHDREIVDRAIEQANKDFGKTKHLDFYTIVNRNKDMVNVILRSTSCDSKMPSVHQKECKLQEKPPQVSCIDCKGIMKPCLLLRQKDEIKKRVDECPPKEDIHRTGSAHAIFQKSGNGHQQQTGCIGCI